MKNIIVIGYLSDNYSDFLSNLKGFNIKAVKNLKDLDALIEKKESLDLAVFTGGADVNPEYYKQELGKFTHIDTGRDIFESTVWKKLPKSTLKLGICRGSQFLTVMSGGSLVQHVSGHIGEHAIFLKDSVFNITSTHHQMMYPYTLNKKSWDLLAHSTKLRSDTYLNGDDKEIDIPNNFLEPEIVYYKNTNALAIQGHPEFPSCETETSNMCLDLIKTYLNK
jgi:gamma-glutamyl-gamma-aminobutyrate hydrolase PuuD